MIKKIYRLLISLIILIIILTFYLSFIGFKTDKFNSKIISQIQQLEPNINVKLNEVFIKLDPFKFQINAKTIGTDLIYRDKILKVETIKSKISLKSFLSNEFLLNEISISTKPLVIKNLLLLFMGHIILNLH